MSLPYREAVRSIKDCRLKLEEFRHPFETGGCPLEIGQLRGDLLYRLLQHLHILKNQVDCAERNRACGKKISPGGKGQRIADGKKGNTGGSDNRTHHAGFSFQSKLGSHELKGPPHNISMGRDSTDIFAVGKPLFQKAKEISAGMARLFPVRNGQAAYL